MPTLTAAARRAEAKAGYDVYLAGCPSRQLLGRLSDKWVGLVLKSLQDGPRRYNEISRTVAGVSQKMLTQTLRTLERDGLVTREVTPSVPVRVDYTLTDLGLSLQGILGLIHDWAEDHMDEVRAARGRYDETAAGAQ